MGFQCCLVAIADNVLNELIEHPGWVLPYIYGPNDDDVGFTDDDFDGLEPPLWTKTWHEDVRGSIEQTWGGINLLMAGSTGGREFPKSFLIHGGVSLLSDADCRGFFSSEVQTISQYINSLDKKTLWEHFNLDMLKSEVYPYARWPKMFDNPENLFPELLNDFGMLKTTVTGIASDKCGMVIIIA